MHTRNNRNNKGNNNGTLTAKLCLVFNRHFLICSLKTSGRIDPDPIIPKPPELLTAEANRQPLHQTIPACIIGYLMSNNDEILLIILFLK